MFRVILVAALGGAVPTFTKMGLEVFPTFTFIFLRFLIAALVLVPFILRTKEKLAENELKAVVLISLLGTGNVVFFAFGVKHTTATVSQLLYAVVPIIVVIASVLILKAVISRRKFVGILLGLVGVIIIVLVPNLGNSSKGLGTIVGNMLVLAAVISYALYTIFSKKLQDKYSPLLLTTMMIITTIIIQTLLLPTEVYQYHDTIRKISFWGVFGLIYVGVVGTALYFLLYQRVVKEANPIAASMIYYLQPIFTFIWSFILLGEKLTLNLLIGSILTLIGAGIVTKKEVEIQNSKTTLTTEEQ